MCRLVAVIADRPVYAAPALVTAPHALQRQSCCDRSGECHPSGWGIGYYANGRPVLVRSTLSAADDPRFVATARDAASTAIVGHIRQASVGGIRDANTHPFAYGRWLFAHNGTVEGFADAPGPLRNLIPERYRSCIAGETDSEHLFYALLGHIEGVSLADEPIVVKTVGTFLNDVVRLYPGTSAEPTRLNLVLTDGRILLATRWQHTLHLSTLAGPDASGIVAVADGSTNLNGVAIASEPVTEEGWIEVPDRSIVIARGNGRYTINKVNDSMIPSPPRLTSLDTRKGRVDVRRKK